MSFPYNLLIKAARMNNCTPRTPEERLEDLLTVGEGLDKDISKAQKECEDNAIRAIKREEKRYQAACDAVNSDWFEESGYILKGVFPQLRFKGDCNALFNEPKQPCSCTEVHDLQEEDNEPSGHYCSRCEKETASIVGLNKRICDDCGQSKTHNQPEKKQVFITKLETTHSTRKEKESFDKGLLRYIDNWCEENDPSREIINMTGVKRSKQF